MSLYPKMQDLGPLFAPRAGEELRDRGIEQAERANAIFVARMRQEAEAIARRDGEVHIDSVRARAIVLGLSPKSSGSWGAIFAERGKWEIIGWRASEFPDNHFHKSPVRRLAK